MLVADPSDTDCFLQPTPIRPTSCKALAMMSEPEAAGGIQEAQDNEMTAAGLRLPWLRAFCCGLSPPTAEDCMRLKASTLFLEGRKEQSHNLATASKKKEQTTKCSEALQTKSLHERVQKSSFGEPWLAPTVPGLKPREHGKPLTI